MKTSGHRITGLSGKRPYSLLTIEEIPVTMMMKHMWACSSAGRAHGLQPWGREFDPPQVHQLTH